MDQVLAALLAQLSLVELHGIGGQVIYINPPEVTSVREPRGLDSGHWVAGIRCLLLMADGKFITVTEPCTEVRHKLELPRWAR